MFIATVYMTRWIQLLTSPPRKAIQERSEAVQRDDEQNDGNQPMPLRAVDLGADDGTSDRDPLLRPPQSHAAAYITIRGQNLDDPLSSFSDVVAPLPHIAHIQHNPRQQRSALRAPSNAMARADRWAEWLNSHLDGLFYSAVLLLVGIPLYYVSSVSYAMPLQLSVNVLMFFGAMALPPPWRQILHPVLVSAFSTLLVIWLLGRIRGEELSSVLEAYRPGYTYLRLWADAAHRPALHMRPGAGDMLASALDASIVSLALPMYQYRRELRLYFWAIVVPNIALSVASLFAYPVVCYAIGISAERSLAFTSRSLTLALATPAVRNIGGDLNTIAAVAVLSGVLGVLIGRRVMSWLRIPEGRLSPTSCHRLRIRLHPSASINDRFLDDYVTRGVTFGANASALGTSLLLRVDPRAAAISSLAMGLFGTITVAFSSIPSIVHVIRSLVGLS